MRLNLQRGFYTEDRGTLTSLVFGDSRRMAAWTFIKSQVLYSRGYWRFKEKTVMLQPGQFVCKIRSASKLCGMAQDTFKRKLLDLQRLGLLTIETVAGEGTIVRLNPKVLDAPIQTGALNRDHKERKDLTKSYNRSVDLITKHGRPGGQSVMGVEQTTQYQAKRFADAVKPDSSEGAFVKRQLREMKERLGW